MRGREARIQIRHQRKKLQEHRKPKEIRLARDANFSNGIDLSVYSRMWIRDTDGIDRYRITEAYYGSAYNSIFARGPSSVVLYVKSRWKVFETKKKES